MKTEMLKDKEIVRCQNCPVWKPHKKGVTGRCRDLKQTTLLIDYCELKDIPDKLKIWVRTCANGVSPQ